jgi:N-acetylglucosamine-6-phosphate deacetylase
MLVTDAMPPAGTDMTEFSLMGRRITVADGTLRSDDGTLAGSALTMVEAYRNAVTMLRLDPQEASGLASGNPAAFLRLDHVTGAIAPGLRADLVHLDADHRVTRTWIGGELMEHGG